MLLPPKILIVNTGRSIAVQMQKKGLKSFIDKGFGNCTNLKHSFHWYEESFVNALSESYKDFLSSKFQFSLISISDRPNDLWKYTEYFITQKKLTPFSSTFIRVSEDAAKLILDNSFGYKDSFSLSKMTELEARALTALNLFSLSSLKSIFISDKKIQQQLCYEDINYINFIFGVYKDEEEFGRIIYTLPEDLLIKAHELTLGENPLSFEEFDECTINTRIIAGSTKVLLDDLKKLEVDDIVLLDNSNIGKMRLKSFIDKEFRIHPDPNMILDVDNDDEEDDDVPHDKSEALNIWDNIQIDVKAEFEKIKMSLGELRQIEEGLIIDVAPIVKNKIALKVENKSIALGELVIIGDRYGVKVTNVFRENNSTQPAYQAEEHHQEEVTQHQAPQQVAQQAPSEDLIDEDFDYSDFDLDSDI